MQPMISNHSTVGETGGVKPRRERHLKRRSPENNIEMNIASAKSLSFK